MSIDRMGEPQRAGGGVAVEVATAGTEDKPAFRWTHLLRQPSFVIGVILLAVVVIPVLLAPVIAGVGPDVQNPAATFLGPSLSHLMGTDQYGRSIWGRVLHGGRSTIWASAEVVVLGGIVG